MWSLKQRSWAKLMELAGDQYLFISDSETDKPQSLFTFLDSH